jgi:hypothetical protein
MFKKSQRKNTCVLTFVTYLSHKNNRFLKTLYQDPQKMTADYHALLKYTVCGFMYSVLTSVVEPYRFIAVPVPTLEKFQLRFRIQIRNPIKNMFGTAFQKNLFIQNLAFFLVRSIIVSQNVILAFLIFYYFCIPFFVRSGSKPSSKTGTHSSSGST